VAEVHGSLIVDKGSGDAVDVEPNTVSGAIDRCEGEEVINALTLVTWNSVGDCDESYGWEGVIESSTTSSSTRDNPPQ